MEEDATRRGRALGRSSSGGGVEGLVRDGATHPRWVGRPLTPPACSVAILLYLSRKYKTEAHWYPPELQARTRVDEYLAWQHSAIQQPATNTCLCKVSLPAVSCRLEQALFWGAPESL